MAELPFSLAALLGMANSQPQRAGPSITLLTLPGRGLVGAAITPNGQEPGFPLPLGLLQSLGGQVSRVPAPTEEDAAADALGGIMRMMMEQMAQIAMQRSMEESGPKVPPASERVRDALPRVVVTKEDLLDATNSKCSVCLEDYRAGFRATRMLCGHLFCTSCIREWLREANSCPVCRFELATDCEDFESGRRTRMSGRTVRLRAAELRMLRISELRRLMDALGVSGEGCLERADLLRHLEGAPDVEVMPEVSAAMAEKQHHYDLRDLEKLELPLLRNLMERHRVPFDLEEDLSEEDERRVALRNFADSGWLRKASKASATASPRKEPKEPKEPKELKELKEPKEPCEKEKDEEPKPKPAEAASEQPESHPNKQQPEHSDEQGALSEAEKGNEAQQKEALGDAEEESGEAEPSRGKASRPSGPPPARRRPRPGSGAAVELRTSSSSGPSEPSGSSAAGDAV